MTNSGPACEASGRLRPPVDLVNSFRQWLSRGHATFSGLLGQGGAPERGILDSAVRVETGLGSRKHSLTFSLTEFSVHPAVSFPPNTQPDCPKHLTGNPNHCGVQRANVVLLRERRDSKAPSTRGTDPRWLRKDGRA